MMKERSDLMSSPAQSNPSSGTESRPPQVMPVSVLAESELGSEAQRERRKRILDATLAIASKGGYEAVQMRAVAERADVAVGTLYRYFPSKELLYAEVLLTWGESFDGRVRTRAHASTDAERLRAALRRTVRAYERHPSFFRLLSALEIVTDPAVSDRFLQFASRFTDALAGTLVDTPEKERASIAFVTSTVLGGVLRGWALRGVPISRVYERVDEMVDLIFSGPRAASGTSEVPDRPR
jgi:TetR/AcrR family transcriptional regulator, cholesterol catabolism regulator